MELRGAVDGASAPSVFVLFRDSPLRRAALDAPPGSAERYWLFGADQLAERGFPVRHNLEAGIRRRVRHRVADRLLRRSVEAAGGYAGDFATVLASRRAANASDVVFSTVDTVGIPAVLLARARLVRPPLVYASIGLLERVARLRTRRARRLYREAFARVAAIVAYGDAEAEALRDWLGAESRVHFVPFGVDADWFRPAEGVDPVVDVVSIGADPRRDYELLARVAARMPDRIFGVVASADQARALALPPNLAVDVGVPFAEIRDRLAAARVVALPVRENLYTGATTTLLQAMAMAKPVVVSRTAAIATGYELVDGENCRLVPPGDPEAFEAAVAELLAHPYAAHELGRRARATVERHLTWERYVDAIADVLRAAAA